MTANATRARGLSSTIPSSRFRTQMALDSTERCIVKWTVLHRIGCIVLLVASSQLLLPFDTSHVLQLRLDAPTQSLSSFLALPFLRWDTLHFLGIASPRSLPSPHSVLHASYGLQDVAYGLSAEHSLAFQPGIIGLLRLAGYHDTAGASWSPSQSLLLVSILSTVISCTLPFLLYR